MTPFLSMKYYEICLIKTCSIVLETSRCCLLFLCLSLKESSDYLPKISPFDKVFCLAQVSCNAMNSIGIVQPFVLGANWFILTLTLNTAGIWSNGNSIFTLYSLLWFYHKKVYVEHFFLYVVCTEKVRSYVHRSKLTSGST